MNIPLSIAGLKKSFGKRQVLRDVNFCVSQGEIVGLLGPNGAGKSTLMRIILGFETQDEGTALTFGRNYLEFNSPVRSVGSLLDPTWVDERLTAETVLLAHALRLGLPKPKDTAINILTEVEMLESRKMRIGKMSLGMRQRIAIGLAIMGDPKVLILDEPVNGLDATGVLWLRKKMKSYSNRGGAVLLSSHLMSEMELVADRVVILSNGTVTSEVEINSSDHHNSWIETRPVRNKDKFIKFLKMKGAQLEQSDKDVISVRGLDASLVFECAVNADAPLSLLFERSMSLEDQYLEAIEKSKV